MWNYLYDEFINKYNNALNVHGILLQREINDEIN